MLTKLTTIDQKKSRTHLTQSIPSGAKVSNDSEQADDWNAPRSIVARASKVSPYVNELITGNNVRIVIMIDTDNDDDDDDN